MMATIDTDAGSDPLDAEQRQRLTALEVNRHAQGRKEASVVVPKREADREDEGKSFRLDGPVIAVIEDIAKGVEEGEAGLKSCTAAGIDISCGVSRSSAQAMHESVAIEDEDECFNMMGELLAKGFSFEEVAKRIHLDGGATHLLSLERWCQLIRLECNADEEPITPLASRRWRGSALHQRRTRCRNAFWELKQTREGTDHASILHIVYGWPDPFVSTLPPEVRATLGKDFAPLARYTGAVETKRQELVKAHAANSTRAHVSHVDRNSGVVRLLVTANAEIEEMHRLAVNHRVEVGANVFDLERHRSAAAYADRLISSGDALRAGIELPRARHHEETKEHYREHVAGPAKHARESFLTAIRIDANKMLSAASRAFSDAWKWS